jgi:hypothetical protein
MTRTPDTRLHPRPADDQPQDPRQAGSTHPGPTEPKRRSSSRCALRVLTRCMACSHVGTVGVVVGRSCEQRPHWKQAEVADDEDDA